MPTTPNSGKRHFAARAKNQNSEWTSVLCQSCSSGLASSPYQPLQLSFHLPVCRTIDIHMPLLGLTWRRWPTACWKVALWNPISTTQCREHLNSSTSTSYTVSFFFLSIVFNYAQYNIISFQLAKKLVFKTEKVHFSFWPPPGYLAYEFDKFWVAEEPESIMHFNQYREKFHDIVKTHLQDPDVALTLTICSDKN